MKLKTTAFAIAVVLTPVLAQADNVALGKTVTLNGTFYTSSGWSGDNVNPTSTVVDGVFEAEATQWNTAGIWWNGSINTSNSFTIDLAGLYTITSFVVQADDNDTYRIEYFSEGDWITAYDVPVKSAWGLVTRDLVTIPSITTNQLRITATGGDGLYSVSEVVANGTASVPEPATMLLFGTGLTGLAALGRRKNN